MNRWYFQIVRTKRGRVVRYYVTDRSGYDARRDGLPMKGAVCNQKLEPVWAGDQSLPGENRAGLRAFARAQIRVFLKMGHYDSEQWPDVWTWMRVTRSRQPME